MQNRKLLSTFFSTGLLVSSLALLTGCEWFKKSACPACEPCATVDVGALATASPEDVLLSIDGKPAITKQQFEDFYEVAKASAGPYGALPKKDAFNTLVTMEILNRKIIKDKKDQDPEYKKEFARAYNLARWGVNSQLLAKDIQCEIDVSDKAIEDFYMEQRGKNQAFDRPPFLKNPESVTMKSVQFSDKKAAEDFTGKAQKEGVDFGAVARAANLAVKDLGKVSSQSQDVDFAVRLKARTIAPNSVELVTSGDTFFVVKAGDRMPAEYADYEEVKQAENMQGMLGQFKKQCELEPAFLKRIEEYKKEFSIVENEEFFKQEEAKRIAQEEEQKKMFAQVMKAQAEQQKADKPAEVAPQPEPNNSGTVAL